MYNYDNRGLVLTLCQLNRYKHHKDVSHIRVCNKTGEDCDEENCDAPRLSKRITAPLFSRADHLRVMRRRI